MSSICAANHAAFTDPLEGDGFYYHQLTPATLGLSGSKNEWLALSFTPCCLIYALLGYLFIFIIPPMVFHIFIRYMFFCNQYIPICLWFSIKLSHLLYMLKCIRCNMSKAPCRSFSFSQSIKNPFKNSYWFLSMKIKFPWRNINELF